MEYNRFLQDKLKVDWPYSVKYEQEKRDKCDVLIIGGGLAGCFAYKASAMKN